MPTGSAAVPPITDVVAVSVGQAPALAMGMTDLAMADSIGLAMQNAVSTQQRGQVIGQATLAQVLAMILAKGAAGK